MTDLIQDYYDTLGRFIHQFGRTEDLLNRIVHRLLVQQLNARHQAALQTVQSVLGGMRVKMSNDTIKRALRVSGASLGMRTEADRVLNQLSEIHYIRDRLVHNTAYPDDSKGQGWFYTNNNITVRENEQIDVIRFKLEVLTNMTADLERIPDLLERALFPESTKTIDEELRTDPDHGQRIAALYAPWRYKLSQLRRTGPRSRPSPQARRRQRRPSRKRP
jgi:hypothetical protein